MNLPEEAIVAVTLNCNARCVMCDIWKNKVTNEVSPDFYRKLPQSLKYINITGGEPFLRGDLPEIVKIISDSCKNARIVISTNGYLVNRIEQLMKEILKYNRNIGVRISLDGYGEVHTKTRGLPLFFEHAVQTLDVLKKLKVRDLGLGYTLMEHNKNELSKVFNYCEEENIEFSLTVATDSPIYFGEGKFNLRPKVDEELRFIFNELVNKQYSSFKPKAWVRAWFNEKLFSYIENHVRYYNCGAADDFFYLDSVGRIYACHIKPWLMGDLKNTDFSTIFNSKAAEKYRKNATACQDCWMVCSARTAIKKNIFSVLKEIVFAKCKRYLN